MKRILALSLLFIFLAGQLNLTLASHYCGSIKVETTMSLGKVDLDCGMEEMQTCDRPSENEERSACLKIHCCVNEYSSADTDDFFNASEQNIIPQVFFVHYFFISFLDQFLNESEQDFIVTASPPLIHPDKQVWYQTFLI